MGIRSELLAIGKYDPTIVDLLPYSKHRYENIAIGTNVVVEVGKCTGSSTSARLAELLDMHRDPDNHVFKMLSNDPRIDAIEEYLGFGGCLFEGVDHRGLPDNLRRLAKNGFIFIFREDT